MIYYASERRVETDSLWQIRSTVEAIISECMYASEPCTKPQALAAAFSVPDGAPITMACANIGPEPDEEVCSLMARHQQVERALVRRHGRK